MSSPPRLPTPQEVGQLVDLLSMANSVEKKLSLQDVKEIQDMVNAASIAVFDDYHSQIPPGMHPKPLPYSGKVMCVVWSDGPSYNQVLTWFDDGRIWWEDTEQDM